jgi:hypothetical protein
MFYQSASTGTYPIHGYVWEGGFSCFLLSWVWRSAELMFSLIIYPACRHRAELTIFRFLELAFSSNDKPVLRFPDACLHLDVSLPNTLGHGNDK